MASRDSKPRPDDIRPVDKTAPATVQNVFDPIATGATERDGDTRIRGYAGSFSSTETCGAVRCALVHGGGRRTSRLDSDSDSDSV